MTYTPSIYSKNYRFLNWLSSHDGDWKSAYDVINNSDIFSIHSFNKTLTVDELVAHQFINDDYLILEKGIAYQKNRFQNFYHEFNSVASSFISGPNNPINVGVMLLTKSQERIIDAIFHSIWDHQNIKNEFRFFVKFVINYDEYLLTENCHVAKDLKYIEQTKREFSLQSDRFAGAFSIRIKRVVDFMYEMTLSPTWKKSPDIEKNMWIQRCCQRLWDIGELLERMESLGFKINVAPDIDPKSLSIMKKMEMSV